ncbi:MAG: hypothetical protein WCP56_01705 [Candidatus Saccharibacteria bacterium]
MENTPSSDIAGAQFLHKKDGELHHKPRLVPVDTTGSSPREVLNPVEYEQARLLDLYKSDRLKEDLTSDSPAIKIDTWMGILERTHGHRDSPNVLKKIKESYHKHYVIKADNIPESVFGLEVKIARERGDRNIPPYDEFKDRKTQEIVSAQQASLDRWVDYLTSEDADAAGYPMWAKYWAFMAVTKMGRMQKHPKEDGTIEVKFDKRDEHTAAPFPELNSKALAQTIDAMQKHLEQQGLPKAERKLDNTSRVLSDEKFRQFINNGSFAQLYGQFLAENPSITTERLQETRGEWVKYEQGSDATDLYQSLQGHTLEWCTAGALDTAQNHLEDGDFYVYYSFDASGQPIIPRIAIRMEDDRIAEIRGIEHDQHLDAYIGEVLESKIQDERAFPNSKEYIQGTEDMKQVTAIEAKLGARYNDLEAEFLGYDTPNVELTTEELRFIYQLDNKIVSLGYGEDPRIEQIKQGRDIKADLSSLLDLPQEQISLTKDEALSGGIVYHYGDLDLRSLTSAEGLTLPQSVSGNLILNNLTSAEGLTLPQSVGGYLILNNLTSAEGLTLPHSVGGGLDLYSLTSAEGLNLPQFVGGYLDLYSLTSAEGLTFPSSVDGYIDLSSLTSAEGLILPQVMGGGLRLASLTTAEGLNLPLNMGGGLDLRSLTSAEGLNLPEFVGGDLYLCRLTSAEGLTLPQAVLGTLYLDKLISAEGLILPQSMVAGAIFRSLTSTEGLNLPEFVRGLITFASLTDEDKQRLREQRPDLANNIG